MGDVATVLHPIKMHESNGLIRRFYRLGERVSSGSSGDNPASTCF